MAVKAEGRARLSRLLWPPGRGPRLLRVVLLVDVALALALAIMWGPGRDFVAFEARRRLTRSLGPAASYEVEISATWWQLLWGEVPAMQIHARDLLMKDGLRVAVLDARIEGLKMRANTITAMESACYRAELSEDALNAYLPIRPQKMRFEPSVRLTLRDDRVDVRAYQVVFGVPMPMPLQASGRLRASDPTHLRFTVGEASFGLSRLPAWLRDFTVLDLGPSPFGVRVDALQVTPGRVVVTGTAAPPLPLVLRPADASPSPSPSEMAR